MSFYRTRGKRMLDVAVAGLALLLTSPLHLLCALAVGATSGRPIYFTQERAGTNNVPFRLFKFRTMLIGTHEASGGYPTEAMITPVGRLMRKTSLDEVPQLMNILRGDMSIVGPRPTLPEQATRYSPRQRGRLAVRPGLTGLAQVRYRNSAPWSVRIESDLEYIEKVSFWNDLKIVAVTIPAVISGGTVKTGQTAEEVDDLGSAGTSDE